MAMKKWKVLQRISDIGVVAVIRTRKAETAENIAWACREGGLPAVEITFTIPGADRVIRRLREEDAFSELIVGAGTVLDSETARIAILAGAQFGVSPGFDEETARLCNRYQIPYIPGCLSALEIIRAMECGAEVIKFFPGAMVEPSVIKAIKGPLPQVSIMPSGGVDLDNVEDWIRNGADFVSVGSHLTDPGEKGDYRRVKELAAEFVERVRRARGQREG
jgi:2-dehydro-3-deoxyphosphogluconate aldolase/(4S)-4-hydroxy-2-oxoglutarate aldolase